MSAHDPTKIDEARLSALRQYDILDSAQEPGFDRIVRLAQRLFDVPISLISFVDRDRQWFKAQAGWLGTETPRAQALCSIAVASRQTLIIPDALQDPRFEANPLVQQEGGIRFYAGAPLITAEGFALGTICVVDTAPRPALTPDQEAILTDLAAAVMSELELRRELAGKQRAMRRSALREAILTIVAEAPNFQTAIDAATAAIRASVDGLICQFFRQAPNTRRLQLVGGEYAAGDGTPTVLDAVRNTEPSLDNSVAGDTILNNRQMIVPDVSPAILDRYNTLSVMHAAGLRAMVVTPITVGDERCALTIGFAAPRADLDAIADIVAGIASAIRPMLRRLRDTEETELFRRVVQASSDMVLITEAEPIDEPGPRITFVNNAFVAGTGYRAEEVLGRTPRFLQGPGTPAEARRALREAMRARRPIQQEVLNYRRDGTSFWAELNISPVMDATGWLTHWVSIQRDITRRRMETNELSESEAAFRLLFERHPLPMWLYEQDTLRFIEVNSAAVQVYGWSREEFLAMSILDIRPEADRAETVRRAHTRPAATTVTGPWSHFTKAGGTLRMMVRSNTIELRGRPAILVVAWDVTEQLRAEAGLRAVTARLNTTFESIGDGLFTLDREWRFSQVNARAGVLLNRTAERLLGRNIWEEFPEARGTELYARLMEAAEGGHTVQFEFHFAPWDRWFDISAYPSPEGLTVYLRDVTERRRQRALLEWQGAMLDEAKDAIIIRTLNNRILYWNRTAERIYGWTAAEAQGHPISDLIYADPAPLEDATRQVLSHQRWSGRLTHRRKDGTKLTVQGNWSLIPASPSREACILAINSDLTEMIALEEQLNQASRLDAIGQLTGGVAHDFNNLLTVILGNSEMLADALVDNPDLGELAQLSLNAAERGAELTHRLLAFARKQPLAPLPTDINHLIGGMESLIRRTLGEQNEIRLIRTTELWPARVDRAQLESSLLNLCINARDAMLPKGGRLTLETANTILSAEDVEGQADVQPGAYVLITVIDTGCGMSHEVLARAFEPFFTTKNVGAGSGLGMSMVFGFVKQSGGHIRLDSAPGEGTSVRIYLPRTSLLPKGQAADAHVALAGRGERILVVEDDDLVRSQVEAQLHTLGYRAVSAANGPAALAILHSGQEFDLLFTDVVMSGGMSGRDLADHVAKSHPRLPVLFTSGYAENVIMHQGRLEPGVQMLQKPYRRVELAAKIRAVLEGTAAS